MSQLFQLKLDLISIAAIHPGRYYVKISTERSMNKSPRTSNGLWNRSFDLSLLLHDRVTIDIYRDPHLGFDKWIGRSTFAVSDLIPGITRESQYPILKISKLKGSLRVNLTLATQTLPDPLAVPQYQY